MQKIMLLLGCLLVLIAANIQSGRQLQAGMRVAVNAFFYGNSIYFIHYFFTAKNNNCYNYT